MARPFSFQPLLDLAHGRVDAATQRLALLRLRWQSQQDKLQQLFTYQEEYRQRLTDAQASGIGMAHMRDFQVFLRKLELAIRQQQSEVQQAQFSWEEYQRTWLEERRKLKTFEILKQRHQRAEAIRENRLEQRDQDEYARIGFHRNRAYEDE